MNPLYHDAIERRLAVPLQEGPDKVTTLAEAVRGHVHAGDTLYLGSAHGRPNPVVRELVRQWWGKSPGFTLATVGVGSPWTALIHRGLVRRVVTTFMGEGYPFPTPQVSDRGVYEKAGEHGELWLTGLFGDVAEADLVRAAREACGWDLQVAPTLRRFAAPTADELALVRLFDPRRYFLG